MKLFVRALTVAVYSINGDLIFCFFFWFCGQFWKEDSKCRPHIQQGLLLHGFLQHEFLTARFFDWVWKYFYYTVFWLFKPLLHEFLRKIFDYNYAILLKILLSHQKSNPYYYKNNSNKCKGFNKCVASLLFVLFLPFMTFNTY